MYQKNWIIINTIVINKKYRRQKKKYRKKIELRTFQAQRSRGTNIFRVAHVEESVRIFHQELGRQLTAYINRSNLTAESEQTRGVRLSCFIRHDAKSFLSSSSAQLSNQTDSNLRFRIHFSLTFLFCFNSFLFFSFHEFRIPNRRLSGFQHFSNIEKKIKKEEEESNWKKKIKSFLQ